MPKTIDDLHALLTGHGYICERPLDMIVATTITTQVYKSPAGEKALEILLTFDNANACVAIEILHAFDLKKAAHREATLACLMAASFRTPLLRPSLDPADGEIRMRIDCPCGADGARDRDVLTALALLPSFVEAWYPQVAAAMQKGKFDANKVAHINLSRITGHPTPAPDATAPDAPAADAGEPNGPSIGSLMRAAAISAKPGGHANRLKVLAQFRRWLEQQGGGDCERN